MLHEQGRAMVGADRTATGGADDRLSGADVGHAAADRGPGRARTGEKGIRLIHRLLTIYCLRAPEEL